MTGFCVLSDVSIKGDVSQKKHLEKFQRLLEPILPRAMRGGGDTGPLCRRNESLFLLLLLRHRHISEGRRRRRRDGGMGKKALRRHKIEKHFFLLLSSVTKGTAKPF